MSSLSSHRLTRQVIRGTLWQSGGTVLTMVVRLGVMAILARLVLPHEFGLLASAMIVIEFPTVFIESGLNQFLVRKPALDQRDISTAFSLALLFGILTSVAVYVGAPLISSFFQTESLTPLLRVLLFLSLIHSVSLISISLLQRDLQFRALSISDVVSFTIGYGGIGVYTAWLQWGVWALVAAAVSQALIKTCIILIVRPQWPSVKLKRTSAVQMLQYSFSLSIARIGNYIALQGDYLVVGRGLGIETLGFYSRAYTLMAQPARIFGKIGQRVLFPAFSKIEGDQHRLATAYRRALTLNALIWMPASALMAQLAPEIVDILLGPNWDAVVVPLRILAIGAYFRIAYKVCASFIIAKGAIFRWALLQWIYGLLIVACTFLALPLGLPAVAVAVVVVLFAMYLLINHAALRLGQIQYAHVLPSLWPAIWLTICVVVTSWGTAHFLRTQDTAAWLTGAATVLASFITLLVMIRVQPLFFLGSDGMWWLQMLSSQVNVKLDRVLPQIVAYRENF